MKAEFLKNKVMLYSGVYFMSIWQDGTIFKVKEENGKFKDNSFSVEDNIIFDKMFRDFLNRDYKIIA